MFLIFNFFFSEVYQVQIVFGVIEFDVVQVEVVVVYVVFDLWFVNYNLKCKQGFFVCLFSGGDKDEVLCGFYIYGEVGCGKIMLMDLFFQYFSVEYKWCVYFYEFMVDVYECIYDYCQSIVCGEIVDFDVIVLIVMVIFEESWLFCFDEFYVIDIVDVMIFGWLFVKLFEFGIVVVVIFNVVFEDFYKGGLNCLLFLFFIKQIIDYMDVVWLDVCIDFWFEKLQGVLMWLMLVDVDVDVVFDCVWIRMLGGVKCCLCDILIKGWILYVLCLVYGVVWFLFVELCEKLLGVLDYFRLVYDYYIILVDYILVMDVFQCNVVKCFIMLIDMFYDNVVKLMVLVDVNLILFYFVYEGIEVMEFKWIVLCLIEMSLEFYLVLVYGCKDFIVSGFIKGLVEIQILIVC